MFFREIFKTCDVVWPFEKSNFENTSLAPGRWEGIHGKYRVEKKAKRFTVFFRTGINVCVIFLETIDSYLSFKKIPIKIGEIFIADQFGRSWGNCSKKGGVMLLSGANPTKFAQNKRVSNPEVPLNLSNHRHMLRSCPAR